MKPELKRIILHWTAGRYTPSKLDLNHYHYVIDGNGVVCFGALPVEANKSPLGEIYAAHTLNCNSDSIGVAIAAMGGAMERPFNASKWPVRQIQLEAMAGLVAGLCKQYGISLSRETVLTHAEVQPTLGIHQKGKWDITWLPSLPRPIDPVAAGDMIRAMVADAMQPKARPAPMPVLLPYAPIDHGFGLIQDKVETVRNLSPWGVIWGIIRRTIGG